jgi:hypothetical protein
MVNFAAALSCKGCGAALGGRADGQPVFTQPQKPFVEFLTRRPGAILMLLFFIGIGFYNWHSLLNRRYYYPKMAFLTPLGILIFSGLAVSPGFIHRPRDTKYKVQIWILLLVGLGLGALNFYLMGWVY